MKKKFDAKVFQKLFDNASPAIFIWNNDNSWSVKYVSKNVSKIFGYKAKAFLKNKIFYEDCIHKDFVKKVKEEFVFYSENGSEFFEHKPYKIVTKSKEEKWVLDQTVIDRDKDGNIIQYIGYISDVTQLMNLNAKNQNLEKKVSVVLESIKDGIWEWNLQTNEVYYSKQWKSMLGYEEDELENSLKTFYELMHKDDRRRVKGGLQKNFKKKDEVYNVKFRLRAKDGNYKWILARGKVFYDKDSKPKEMLGSHVDISHLRELEDKLRESEDRWQFALEGSGDGVWDWNIETGEVYFSTHWKEMLGYKDEDIKESLQSWIDLVHPDQLQQVKQDIQNYLDGKSDRYINEHQLLCKDGTYKWILDRGILVSTDKSGKATRMIGTHTDIDKNKKYQEQIDFLNERFTNMFENHDAMMLLIEPDDGQIIDVNKSAQKFYGYSYKEFRKLNISDINTQEQDIIAKIRNEAKDNLKNSFILEHKKKNGELVIIETRSSPIKTEKGTVLFSIIEDITKEQENEKKLSKVLQQLQEAQKVAKLGIWEVDVATLNIEWSDEVYNIFEKDKNDFSPNYESLMQMIHPDDVESINKAYKNSLETKEPYNITHRILLKDGRVKHVREQCDTHFDEEGSPLVSFGTVQDVTELTQLNSKINQERNRYKSLLELSSDGVLIINSNMQVVEYSQLAREMLGYSDKEMKDLKIIDFDVKFKEKEIKQLVSSLSREISTFETIQKRKDGSTYNASVTAVIIEIEGEEFIYASVRDTTDEYKLQKQVMYEKNFVSNIIDSANAIIAVIDSNGVMIKLNKYAQGFSGYTQEEISSEPYKWKVLLPPEIQDKVMNIVQNAKNGNIIRSYQNAWISKSGEKRVFEWSNTLVKKDDGTMDYIATIGIDITQKEEHKKIFETIFNTSKDGLAILDLKSQFLQFNQAYLDITGFSREELLTKSCVGMSVDEDKEKAKRIIKQVLRHGHVDNFEKTCIVKDNKQIVVNMSMAMMPDKKSFLINTKDITLKKAQEDELKRTKELAEKASKSKSEFLANMSHEIRTPLNGMIGLTKLALDTELNNTQKEYLQKSLSSSNILLSVITDILDYSKIEANKIEICQDEFLLNIVMQNLSDMFSYQAYEKGIDYIFIIDPKIPNTLVGDEVRFTQVLTNLIGNAIKFTKKGHVKVHLSLKNTDDDSVSVECLVQDTGIGISKEKQKKLFRAFEQGDSSTTKKYGGTGLGLMISKRLVELMGSQIWLKSKLNEGSTLGFTLKFNYIKGELYNLEKISDFQKKFRLKESHNALLVEDNEINQLVATRLFQQIGFVVDIANNGEEALQKAKANSYDIIFMDIHMPVMSGYTSSLHIREFDTTTPIIALSAAVMQQDKDLSIESKMNGHISKPIDIIEVEKLLAKYFDLEYVKNTQIQGTSIVNINGVDLLGLQKELSCDTLVVYGYYKNFFYSFVDEMHKTLTHKRTSDEMKNFIHKLKGTSGNLKMNSVHALCIKLEENLNDDALFKKLFLELEYVFKEIEEKIIPLTKLKVQTITAQELQESIDSAVLKLKSYELVTNDEIDKIILGLEDKISKESLKSVQKYYINNETEMLCKLLKNIKEDIYE